MISPEQLEREREASHRLNYTPRPMAAFFAGRCGCGVAWVPGDIVFKPLLPRGARASCFDCGLRASEANK